MPGNLLSADIAFPTFTAGQSTDEKLGVVTNYLYMLLEQLRYTMANLGAGNFNDTELAEIGETITKPLSIKLEDAEGNISALTIRADQLTSRMEDAEGNISSIDQYAKSITLSVSNGDTYSSIQLKAGSTVISSQTIYMNGLVTFTGLADGTTTINGGCIKTGTIDAQRINLTGAITWSDLASDAKGQINTANQNAASANDTVTAWKYQGTTYIDGTKLMTGTVTASTIQGGQIALMATEDIQAGFLGLTAASTAGIAVNLTSLGALRLRANQGDIYISRDEGSYPTFLHFQDRDIAVGVDNYTTQLATFRPNMDDVFNLGDSSHAWKQLYLASPIISSSDRRRKAEISYELERYDAVFDALKPASFLLLRHEGDGKHVGFVAQDVEEALSSAGLERGDLAALVCENDVYALRYEEFIPLCVRQIQQLKARVAALEGA